MQDALHSFEYALDYLAELVAHITCPAEWVAQPAGIRNHPAWIIGHLALTCQMLGFAIAELKPWLPADFASRYGTGSDPQPVAAGYESKEVALAILRDSGLRIAAAVRSLDEAALNAPFPDDAYRDIFPTVRHAITQVLVGHTAYHVGQISIWRRAMGLRPMARPFE